MRFARTIELTDLERNTLTKWSRGRSTPARLVLRAKIVLLAADGRLNKDIAADLDTSKKTVSLWRTRFAERRLEGVEKDAPRGGRHPNVRAKFEAEIIRRTTQETPGRRRRLPRMPRTGRRVRWRKPSAASKAWSRVFGVTTG